MIALQLPRRLRPQRGAAGAAPWLVFTDADANATPDLLDRYFDPPPGDRTGAAGRRVPTSGAARCAGRWPATPPARLHGQDDIASERRMGLSQDRERGLSSCRVRAVGGLRRNPCRQDADLTYRLGPPAGSSSAASGRLSCTATGDRPSLLQAEALARVGMAWCSASIRALRSRGLPACSGGHAGTWPDAGWGAPTATAQAVWAMLDPELAQDGRWACCQSGGERNPSRRPRTRSGALAGRGLLDQIARHLETSTRCARALSCVSRPCPRPCRARCARRSRSAPAPRRRAVRRGRLVQGDAPRDEVAHSRCAAPAAVKSMSSLQMKKSLRGQAVALDTSRGARAATGRCRAHAAASRARRRRPRGPCRERPARASSSGAAAVGPQHLAAPAARAAAARRAAPARRAACSSASGAGIVSSSISHSQSTPPASARRSCPRGSRPRCPRSGAARAPPRPGSRSPTHRPGAVRARVVDDEHRVGRARLAGHRVEALGEQLAAVVGHDDRADRLAHATPSSRRGRRRPTAAAIPA